MKYSGIGGQAVIEGVMMKNREDYAVAVRLESGEIKVEKKKYKGIGGSNINRIARCGEFYRLAVPRHELPDGVGIVFRG